MHRDNPMSITVVEREVIARIRPSFLRIGIGYFISAMLSVAAAAVIGALNGSFVLVLLAAGILLLHPFSRHLKRNHRVYTLTTADLEIRYGVFRRTVRNIPLSSIHDVTTVSSLVGRVFGIGEVVIDSRSLPGRIRLGSIRHPREFANLILAQLHRWESEIDLAFEQRGDPSV